MAFFIKKQISTTVFQQKTPGAADPDSAVDIFGQNGRKLLIAENLNKDRGGKPEVKSGENGNLD